MHNASTMAPGLDAASRIEVLAALSLCTDLANGLPFETAVRTGLVAYRLARAAGLEPAEQGVALHAGLLRFLGCTAFAHEEAQLVGGDDIAFRAAFAAVDHGSRADVLRTTLREVGAGLGVASRARVLGNAVVSGARIRAQHGDASCEVATRLADRLGGSAALTAAVADLLERWDGEGSPSHKRGADIAAAARVAHVAVVAERCFRLGGPDAARGQVRARRGGHLDPALADVFATHADEVMAPLALVSAWDELTVLLEDAASWPAAAVELDAVAEAFADFVDLQSVFTLGHSRRVAALAATAGARAALPAAELERLRLCALLHDLGRVSVPTGTWEKPGPLSHAEWERVRLHSHYTTRVLNSAAALAPLAHIAGDHHERVDGSGYPRGCSAASLPLATRILAVADAYAAMREARPHRPAHSRQGAAAELRQGVASGAFDAVAVDHVLAADGHRRVESRAPSTDLTNRELDVLRLVATGQSTKEVAASLGIGARTVKHHVAQIYRKTGCCSRAGVALFAIERGLFSVVP